MLAPAAREFALRAIAAGETGCIPWAGRIDRDGYGHSGSHLAHRVIYQMVVGDLDAGDLDHLCHDITTCAGGPTCPHRSCVNPTHLTPTTRAGNTLRGAGPTAVNARKTACNKGHSFTAANTYITATGGRRCRICGATAQREYQARRRA